MSLAFGRGALAAVIAFATLSGAGAAEVAYVAALDGASGAAQSNSPAIGSLSADFDTATGMLRWRASYSALSSAPISAEFGSAAPGGREAGVVFAVRSPPGVPILGAVRLTDAEARALAEGRLHFSLRTEKHDAGEIGGRLHAEY